MLDSLKDVTLLDVRTNSEWKKGVIGHPVMMDYYSIDFNLKVLELPKNKAVFIYCHSGYRSQKTRKRLLRNGYSEVYELKPGILGWQKSGYPINSYDSLSIHDHSTK
ncbi:MAG: rhodanese-like domain-containing protein [Saprospiraceae bacterium]